MTKESVTAIGLVAAAEDNNVPSNANYLELMKYKDRHYEHYYIVKIRQRDIINLATDVVAERF